MAVINGGGHRYKTIPNHESEYLRVSREPVEGIVNEHMRVTHFEATGEMADDKTIWEWFKPTKAKHKVKKLPKGEGKPGKLLQDGGGGKNYYDLPPGTEQLLDLIEHRNMNGNIKDIFKACYRLGQKDGTSVEYDLRKMALYSLRELGRVTGRKDYIALAIEVAGHHDRIRANTTNKGN